MGILITFMGSLRNRGLSVTRGLIHEEMKEEPATLQESKEDEDFATVVNMSTGAEDPDFPLTQNLEPRTCSGPRIQGRRRSYGCLGY